MRCSGSADSVSSQWSSYRRRSYHVEGIGLLPPLDGCRVWWPPPVASSVAVLAVAAGLGGQARNDGNLLQVGLSAGHSGMAVSKSASRIAFREPQYARRRGRSPQASPPALASVLELGPGLVQGTVEYRHQYRTAGRLGCAICHPSRSDSPCNLAEVVGRAMNR